MARDRDSKRKDVFSSLCFIPCRVEPGMFSSEWLVHLETLNPANQEQRLNAQLFADRRDVAGIRGTPARNDPKPGWLRVEVGEKLGEVVRVILPQPSVQVGDAVLVRGDQVKQEAAR
jgi:hypothetical protein